MLRYVGRQVTRAWKQNNNITSLGYNNIKRFITQEQKNSENNENKNENNNDNNNENNDDIERVFVGQKDTIIERDNYVESMTPKKTVESLNKYIIGQDKAKKAVAVSLRNRWRRQQLDDILRKEVSPMNILMMGPTGSGKTEIARRLAQMVDGI